MDICFFFVGGGKSCYFGLSARYIFMYHVEALRPDAWFWGDEYTPTQIPTYCLDHCLSAPFKKLHDRLKAFSRPTLSIVARCTGFNTFILSVTPYSLSTET